MEGPETFLTGLGISLKGVVDPEADALLDPEHRVFVNWETYFVSSDAALAQFNREPYRFTGRVTDPVTKERFIPGEASPTRRHAGRLFYFSSAETAAAFDADPDALALPMIGMRPVEDRRPAQ